MFNLRAVRLAAIMVMTLVVGCFINIGHGATPETWQFGDSVVYFTSPGCPECEELNPGIRRLCEERGVELVVLDLSSFDNVRLMFTLLRSRGLPVEWAGRSPSLFSRDRHVIEAATMNDVKTLFGSAVQYVPQEKLHFTAVMAAGLVDGLNPCTLNVLLILLSMCLVVGRKHTLGIGLTFIFGVVITYFVIGIGLGHLIAPLRGMQALRSAIYFLYGAVLLYLGLFSPSRWLNKIKLSLGKRIGDVRRPGMGYFAVFFLGVLCSGFEFVCTGQVYLPMVLYLATQQPYVLVSNLVLYNLAFALPMILMVGALHAGLDSESIQKTIKAPVFAHASQVVMLLLAFYFLIQGGIGVVNMLT